MSVKLMELREPRLEVREPRLEAREPRLLLEDTVRELADRLQTRRTDGGVSNHSQERFYDDRRIIGHVFSFYTILALQCSRECRCFV